MGDGRADGLSDRRGGCRGASRLVRLVERAGLRFRAAHAGCTTEPFGLDGRLGLIAERP